MVHYIRYVVFALFFIACFTTVSSAQAPADLNSQSISAQDLFVTPPQITIAGVVGTAEKRTIHLRAIKSISGLQVIQMDLNSDDGTIFPADALNVELPKTEIQTDEYISIPVKVDFKKAASGEFKGQFIIKYQGGEKSVPLTIKIKEHFFWPLIIMVVGVALGMAVSGYRSKGKPRDEANVLLERIETQRKADKDLKNTPFDNKIEQHIEVAKLDIQNGKWADATQKLDQAGALLKLWQTSETEWVKAFNRQKELEENVNNMLPNATYKERIKRDLEVKLKGAPEQNSPDEYRKQLDTLSQQIKICSALEKEYSELEELCERIEKEDERKTWNTNLKKFNKRLKNLSNDSQSDDFKNISEEIQAAIVKVQDLSLSADPRTEPEETRMDKTGEKKETQTDISKSTTKKDKLGHRLSKWFESSWLYRWFNASKSQKKLKIFTWATYVIAVGFLSFIGFNELYLSNPVFGANFWAEYFALIAWGFGAEASRASITDMVKGWGVDVD